MMKILLKVLLALSLVLALLSVPLLVSGSLRDKTFRAAVELPTFFNYLRLRGPMVNRNFSLAARHLNAQLDLVEKFARGRNTMIPGLLANTRFVVEQAVFANDFAALRPYLQRLVSYQEDLFPARLWLAEAMLETEPAKVFVQTDAARALVATDERSYRLAIEAALKTGETGRIELLCRQYQEAKLGAYHFYERNTLFGGSGLREFGLEVMGGDKKGGRLITHSGPVLKNNVSYEFSLSGPETVESLRLHFATPPGLKIRIEQVRFYLEGRHQATLTRDQYVVTSRHGFEVKGGTVTTSRGREMLTLHPKNIFKVQADQLTVTLSVARLGLLSHPACSEGK